MKHKIIYTLFLNKKFILYSHIRLANYSSRPYSITEIMTRTTLTLLITGTAMLDKTGGSAELTKIANGLIRILGAMIENFNLVV